MTDDHRAGGDHTLAGPIEGDPEFEALRDAFRATLTRVYGPELIAWIEADLDGYGKARAQADATEAAFAAALPKRAQEILDGINDGTITHNGEPLTIPDGYRLEWR